MVVSVPDRELPTNSAPKKNNTLLAGVEKKIGLFSCLSSQ